jgi:hypothetical protein
MPIRLDRGSVGKAMDEERHPLIAGAGRVTGLVLGVYQIWCTVIAFVGGNLPLLGWHLKGSIGLGFL